MRITLRYRLSFCPTLRGVSYTLSTSEYEGKVYKQRLSLALGFNALLTWSNDTEKHGGSLFKQRVSPSAIEGF